MSEFDIQLVLAKDGNIKAMVFVADEYYTGIINGELCDRHSIFKARYWYLRLINTRNKGVAAHAAKRLEELNLYLEKINKKGDKHVART